MRLLWRLVAAPVVGNRWGRLALLGAVLTMVAYWNLVYLVEDVYPAARDEVLRAVGLGAIPAALWVTLAMGALGLRRRWLLRWWRWWLASALVVVAVQVVLGAIYGTDGILARATLGGRAGEEMWGGSPLRGIPTVAALVLLAQAVLWPRLTYREARGILGLLRRALRRSATAVWRYLCELGRATRRSARSGIRRARVVASTAPWKRKPVAGGKAVASVIVLAVPEAIEGDLLGNGEGEALEEQLEEEEDVEEATRPAAVVPGKPVARQRVAPYFGRGWVLPSWDLLEPGTVASVTKEETFQVARKIEETLGHHGVQVSVNQVKPGPTVTLYGLSPGWISRYRQVRERDEAGNLLRDPNGKAVVSQREERMRVKVDSIVAREKDLALALAAPSLRIQAPVPGESVVGIEVPNREPVLVTLRSVIESEEFQDIAGKGGLALGLGQGSGGDPAAVDLRRLPHLLIAGATGSGKSVCINALIVSLVSQVSPEKLCLLLVDPKRVELTLFNGLPHLVAPVVVDTEPAVKALKGMLREMFRRYRRLEELGVRNIEGYRRHPQALEAMPYVVIAIDELADLMMAAPYDIEQTLCRLAQLGRATGIHLVVATQRPSVDVVTGLIKANFPSRISFAVVSQVDSRTILDSGGAERLLGKGDMLFLSNETPKPRRVQGAFVSDREIGRLMEFWRSQEGPPLLHFDLEPAPEENQADSWDEAERGSPQDELLEKAKELTSRYSHVSTSLLQRRLRIGYPRAARLMDQLEDEGIIGPGEPGKSREVLRTS